MQTKCEACGDRGERGRKGGEGEAEPGLSRQPGERWLWPECLAGMGEARTGGWTERPTYGGAENERKKKGGREEGTNIGTQGEEGGRVEEGGRKEESQPCRWKEECP